MEVKLHLGDKVRVERYRGGKYDKTYTIVDHYSTGFNYFQLNDGCWYPIRELDLVQAISDEIQIFYRVDGLEFNSLQEAKKHRQKVRLFKLLESTEGGDALLPVVDTFVDNASKIMDILK